VDKFIIKGGKILSGEISAGGSKNAALPILVASLLAKGETVIKNCPDVVDIRYMMKVLEHIGAKTEMKKNVITVKTPSKLKTIAPYDLVRKMRASYYVMGPLIAREHSVEVSLPGGCAIGERPVDLHLTGFENLGCKIKLNHGNIVAKCKKLVGAEMFLEGSKGPSVGATINVMMAATLAHGKTIIKGAAQEPEVGDVARFLVKMGAEIRGIDTPVLEINGVEKLSPVEYEVIPDRIEAGTLLCASAITGGEMLLKKVNPLHLGYVLNKFIDIGYKISFDKDTVWLKSQKKLKSTDIYALPFPGFPTDMQAQFTSLLSVIGGLSIVSENIFEKRFMHIPELNRMGADIEVQDNKAIIKGVKKLSGAPVMASDLRASAALVLAGLVAEGETEIKRIYHIDRGYERIEKKLSKLGAHIRRREE